MFENYSEPALSALYHSRVAAARIQSAVLESEHVLQGIIMENDPVVEEILSQFNVTVLQLEEELEGQAPSFTLDNKQKEIPLSEEVKKILAYTIHEAESMGFTHVSLEHLLLGIMRVDCRASRTLNRYGLNLFTLREALLGFYEIREEQQEFPESGVLEEYCVDLTGQAKEGLYDPLVGREQELERLIHILCRRTKNNPLLIGEPGVGKTAIVEGLAQAVANGNVPEPIAATRLLSLDMGLLVAGTKYRGQFEERIKNILAEIQKDDHCTLVIDEIHMVIGAGAAEGSLDAANLLKPALTRGGLSCIGSTTTRDFRRFIEKDRALMRRFQPIVIHPSTKEETLKILKGVMNRYASYHGVAYPDDILHAIVERASRHIPERQFPDKAIDVLDEVGALVKLRHLAEGRSARLLREELSRVSKEIRREVAGKNFEQAIHLREKAVEIRETLHIQESQTSRRGWPAALAEDVNRVISTWTGVPVTQLAMDEADRLAGMETVLRQRIVGQDAAIDTLAKAIRRSRVGVKSPSRPVGVFLFLGPSGVGKTELARQLAAFLFHDVSRLIRLDMSEYAEKHTVSRLVGAPPGYVGHEEGSRLVEKIRLQPYSVVLLDEIEKAHPEVHNLLLQVMEDGHLTDSLGRRVDFRNTIILMTGNVGSRILAKGAPGFARGRTEAQTARETIRKELGKIFAPEFTNRLDEVIYFNSLTQKDLEQICAILLREFSGMLAADRVAFDWGDSLVPFILEHADLHEVSGARPLRKALRETLEDAVSNTLLNHRERPLSLRALIKEGGIFIEIDSHHPDPVQ